MFEVFFVFLMYSCLIFFCHTAPETVAALRNIISAVPAGGASQLQVHLHFNFHTWGTFYSGN